jgi:hypothetical protein
MTAKDEGSSGGYRVTEVPPASEARMLPLSDERLSRNKIELPLNAPFRDTFKKPLAFFGVN